MDVPNPEFKGPFLNGFIAMKIKKTEQKRHNFFQNAKIVLNGEIPANASDDRAPGHI